MKKCIAIVLGILLLFFYVAAFAADPETSFSAFSLEVQNQGSAENNFRFVVSTKDFPFVLTETNAIGLTVKGGVVTGNTSIPFESEIVSVELRDSGLAVLVVPQTDAVKVSVYKATNIDGATHSWELSVYPELFSGRAPEETGIMQVTCRPNESRLFNEQFLFNTYGHLPPL